MRLTTFDLAERISELRGRLSQREIGIELRAFDANGEEFSESYVGNLERAYRNLAPQLLESWQQEDERLTTDALNRLAVLTHDQQLEWWQRQG